MVLETIALPIELLLYVSFHNENRTHIPDWAKPCRVLPLDYVKLHIITTYHTHLWHYGHHLHRFVTIGCESVCKCALGENRTRMVLLFPGRL